MLDRRPNPAAASQDRGRPCRSTVHQDRARRGLFVRGFSGGGAISRRSACFQQQGSHKLSTRSHSCPRQPSSRFPTEGCTLTPHLVCANAAEAMNFYAKAFNAVEQMRMPGPNSKLIHASMRIGDSTLMLVDENPEWGALAEVAEGITGDDSIMSTMSMRRLRKRWPPARRSRCRLTTCSGAIVMASWKIRSVIIGRWQLTRAT